MQLCGTCWNPCLKPVCIGLCRNLPKWKRRRRRRRKSNQTHFIRSFSILAAMLSRRGGQHPRSTLLLSVTGMVVSTPALPLTHGSARKGDARSEQPSLLPYCWPLGNIYRNTISHSPVIIIPDTKTNHYPWILFVSSHCWLRFSEWFLRISVGEEVLY